MAEDAQQNAQQRSEKPTPKRLEQAKKKGQVPQTRDLYHCVILSSFLFVMWFAGSYVIENLFTGLRLFLEKAGSIHVDGAILKALASFVASLFITTVGLLFLVHVVLILASGILQQQGLRFRGANIKPQLQRISLLAGFKRQFSIMMVLEFTKAVIKFCVALGLVIYVGGRFLPGLIALCGADPWVLLQDLKRLLIQLFLGGVCAAFFLAVVDYSYQWYKWFQRLMMSRYEIKEEQKQSERSPHTTQRQRRARETLAQMRKAKQHVPEATVLITNPTHFAIALLWVPYRMQAPEVLAKGHASVAQYMKKLAHENKIPVMENKSLARSLYATVEPGQAVRPQHYQAVARVIRYVMRLSEKRRQTNFS